jgi:glutamate synthase (NADPH/NADH) small chain
MPIHITEEANRCLNCKVPQCQKACPVHTPIPKVIQMFKQHQVAEAGQMLFDNNPMSAMCSIVCNHEAQCQGHCVLGRKGSPVHFSAIENYVSGTYLDRMKVQKAEPNGKKVAVVGSGPAGLTAAIKLAEAGCDVTIFERSQCIGGVMEYGIPDFRLPRSYVDRLHHHMDEMGIHVRANTDVGDSIRLQDMLSDGYDAVFVGTGAGRARKLGTPGETRADVQFGIDYLVHPTSTQVGKTVAVIGAGNVAMDVARTVLRHGAEQVTLYARSNHISANSDEVEYTELDGAEILCGYAIAGINDEGPYFHVAEFDEEGNVTGYSEDVEQRQADTTMICVSQMPKNRLVITTPGLEADDRGRLVVDENLMTTMPGIFAAGDVISGPKTVVHAVDGAKQAVAGMLRYLGVAEEAAVEA